MRLFVLFNLKKEEAIKNIYIPRRQDEDTTLFAKGLYN